MNKKSFETVAYIHINDKKVLLTRNKGKSAFYMPGGKKNDGESNKDALIRELSEELSIKLNKKSLKQYGVFEAQAYGMPDGTNVRIICFTGIHDGELNPNHEIDKLAFFTHAEYHAMSDTAPAVRLILNDLLTKGLII